MSEVYLGRLKPGMDVCDIAGDKVGTVVHVYQHSLSPVSTGQADDAAVAAEQPSMDGTIEVKTGFLGLGQHLYVPLSAVQDSLEDAVFLSRPKHEFEQLGWHEKPPYLEQHD